MITFSDLEARILREGSDNRPGSVLDSAEALLGFGEAVLEQWILSRKQEPTAETHEGFRLLALQRQGSRGEPSFNACRETCRELAYHYNLTVFEPDHPEIEKRIEMMALLAKHLLYFVSGKLEQSGLGEFCCSSRPLRNTMDRGSEPTIRG